MPPYRVYSTGRHRNQKEIKTEKKEVNNMVTEKRRIEIFTAGCFLCEETLKLVRDLACPRCEIVFMTLSSSAWTG